MLVLDEPVFKVERKMKKTNMFGTPHFLSSNAEVGEWSHEEYRPKLVAEDLEKPANEQMFIKSFLLNNRLEHVEQVMGFHPTYLEAFLKAQNYLLNEDGPLSFPYRHYIAIMAAARHQCVFLMRLHAHEFLLQGGNPEWLEGLSKVPQKLYHLCEVNNILAHRPWLLKKEHIARLVRGQDQFSLSELMQALVIMAHFNTLCSFVYGCGITADTECCGFVTRPTSSGDEESEDYSSDSSGEVSCSGLDEASLQSLMHTMEQMRLESSHEDFPTQEELRKRFETVESQSAEISVPTMNKHMSSRKAEVNLFVIDSEFTYSDFGNRSSPADNQTFRAQDYSWEEHGVSLANELYGDIGDLLDKRFNVAFNLTYYTMGNNSEVDTSAFRQAIWYYIHCMYGIRHDDYDYGKVNKMLEKNVKSYIKVATCYPERINRKDSDVVMRAFKHSERVHVNLMIAEARMQAEMLYVLRAINQHLT